MRRRQHQERTEPLTVSAETISAFLERHQQWEGASLVRRMSDSSAIAWQEAERLRKRVSELEKKYEPREKETRHNPQPPPEASD